MSSGFHSPIGKGFLHTLYFLPALTWLVAAAEPDPSQFQMDPAFEIALWAAEPKIVDPVALCWDADGRAYVAECRDYPFGVGPNGKVGSTIRLLEDTDGDGKPDRSTIFAKDLSYATSVTPWNGGVLVTAPPVLWFLKDTDGDGVADVREALVTGFKLGVSDSLANGLRYGLDHRIHGCNGGNGGTLISKSAPAGTAPVELGEEDFAYDPETGTVTLTHRSGGGFGQAIDDFGHTFLTYNINHLQHPILSHDQVRRFSGFPPIATTVSISDHEEMSRIFPISDPVTRPNHPEQAGHFSAAGGMGIVGSAEFPAEYRGSVFVCDVVGNLVHRDKIGLVDDTFIGVRSELETKREFLASRDPHFRPVAVETGPDGALYVVAMQRAVIEHPDYIGDAEKAKLDLRAGSDQGRIWRITPKGGLKPVMPRLKKATDAELVGHLGNANQWWRLTAQRLLIQRKATAAVPTLRQLARNSMDPLARLHALWTLRGLRALTPEDVRIALGDANAGIRENALILAQDFVEANPALQETVIPLATDTSPRVRFQCAQTMAFVPSSAAAGGLVEILMAGGRSPWTRMAVLSSLKPSDPRFLLTRLFLFDTFRKANDGAMLDVGRDLVELIGARAAEAPEEVLWVLQKTDSSLSRAMRLTFLEALTDGLARGGTWPKLSIAIERHVKQLTSAADFAELRPLLRLCRGWKIPLTERTQRTLEAATETATNSAKPVTLRLPALELVALGDATNAAALALDLTDAQQPPEVQTAALRSLDKLSVESIGENLLKRWRSLAPAARPEAINLLLAHRQYHAALLAAIESGSVTLGELNLDLEQRRRLLRESTPENQARAAKLLGDAEYANRKTVVTEWLAKLPATGDAKRGKAVFESTCSRCHRAGGVGSRVGPDLSAVAQRSVEDILSNILDPNMAINPGFVAYTVETRDGESQTGLLGVQTPDTVVLIQAGEVRQTFPRKNVVKMQSEGRSLMPEGLEAGKTPQELRDLIAFLQATP